MIKFLPSTPSTTFPKTSSVSIANHAVTPTGKNGYIPPKEDSSLLFKSLGILAAAAIGGVLIYKSHTNSLKSVFIKQIEKFKNDIGYKKALAYSIGLPKEQFYKLRPILGSEEYFSIIKAFENNSIFYTPGKLFAAKGSSNIDLTGVKNLSYRANLHMHTINSDGKLSVKKLLDYASDYANKVAASKPKIASHAPFTIAITDHNTVDGCQEAVKLIAQNPQKYKNLRLVLGCELNVEATQLSQNLKTPVSVHMLLHNINPFDKKLNDLLISIKSKKITQTKQLIEECKKALPKELAFIAKSFSFNNLTYLYPMLKKGLNHNNLDLISAIHIQTIFSACIQNNKELIKKLSQHNVDAKALNFNSLKKYFSQINDNFETNYWEKYETSLAKYLAEKLQITEAAAQKYIKIPQVLIDYLKTTNNIIMSTLPKLNLQPEYLEINTAQKILNDQKYVTLGIAHPGLLNIEQCLEQPEKWVDALDNLFHNFKKKSPRKAFFTEIYYKYPPKLAENQGHLETIKNLAKKNGLSSCGGLDTHSDNIFKGH